MISINFWSILITIINLIVLYLLLKKFLIKPINNIIAQREEMIKLDIAEANQIKDDAMNMKKEYEDTLAGVSEECESMRDKSRKEAQGEYDRILNEADEKSNRMLRDAEKTIKMERDKALNDMESQIADLAMVAASKILSQNTDEDRNMSLYDEFLKKAGE